MISRKTRIEKRNLLILNEFKKLNNVKVNGVKKYSIAYIFNQIALKFFLSEFTVEQIVKKTNIK